MFSHELLPVWIANALMAELHEQGHRSGSCVWWAWLSPVHKQIAQSIHSHIEERLDWNHTSSQTYNLTYVLNEWISSMFHITFSLLGKSNGKKGPFQSETSRCILRSVSSTAAEVSMCLARLHISLRMFILLLGRGGLLYTQKQQFQSLNKEQSLMNGSKTEPPTSAANLQTKDGERGLPFSTAQSWVSGMKEMNGAANHLITVHGQLSIRPWSPFRPTEKKGEEGWGTGSGAGGWWGGWIHWALIHAEIVVALLRLTCSTCLINQSFYSSLSSLLR